MPGSTMVTIPTARLVPDPAQPRVERPAEEFRRLVESVRIRGLLAPIRVRPADADGRHMVVSGHGRLAALIENGITAADCVIAGEAAGEAETLAEQLIENLVRQDLSAIEEARGYRRFITLKGITAARAAEELAVPASRISRGLTLLDLPDEVQRYVHSGWVHADTGYYLARLPAGEERDRLVARAVAGELTRDDAARAAKPTPQASLSQARGRVTCKLGGGRSLTVSDGAVTLESLIATLEEVLREARKARTQGWHVGTLAKVFRDRAAKGGAA